MYPKSDVLIGGTAQVGTIGSFADEASVVSDTEENAATVATEPTVATHDDRSGGV